MLFGDCEFVRGVVYKPVQGKQAGFLCQNDKVNTVQVTRRMLLCTWVMYGTCSTRNKKRASMEEQENNEQQGKKNSPQPGSCQNGKDKISKQQETEQGAFQ
jgi:hypothetical protein